MAKMKAVKHPTDKQRIDALIEMVEELNQKLEDQRIKLENHRDYVDIIQQHVIQIKQSIETKGKSLWHKLTSK